MSILNIILLGCALCTPQHHVKKTYRPDAMHRQRLTSAAYKRAEKYEPIFRDMALKYDIPVWLLLGVAQQESNMGKGRVSHTSDYGIMQIHCSKRGFSWLSYLRKRGLKVKRCKDLHDPRINIEAGAIILKYCLHWERKFVNTDKYLLYSLTTYNAGIWRNKGLKPAYQYKNHVVWYGMRIEKHLDSRSSK